MTEPKTISRPTPPTKHVFIKTYGCQMNVYDSERMAEALGAAAYAETAAPEDADLIILNTCHIREKAAEKVYSELGRLRILKEARADAGRETMIAVAGCVAQAEGQEMVNRAPVIDLVVGPQAYHRLPALIDEARSKGGPIVYTEFDDAEKFASLPKARPARGYSAFLTVQEGCDKFCTFCVVPYTRGAEFSRPVDAVVAEAQGLVDQGVREVTLLGQNVNAYHGIDGDTGAQASLAALLNRLAAIDGLARIRYTTSHPNDMTDDLFAAHGALDKLMPYLHLPFQAGSDRMLAAMNRRHTVAQYRDVIARMRDARPDLALSTDIIVGFPGETDADFQGTLDLVDEITFAQAFSFKYSSRPGTPAARMDGAVAEEVKTERLAILQAKLRAQQAEFNASCVGRKLPVLFEKAGRLPGQLVGRSPYLQPVHADGGPELIGTIADVSITATQPNSLGGVINAGDAQPRATAA